MQCSVYRYNVKQLVKEQTPDGYVTERKILQFNIEKTRCNSALEIKIDKERAEARLWNITLQSENKVKRVRGPRI